LQPGTVGRVAGAHGRGGGVAADHDLPGPGARQADLGAVRGSAREAQMAIAALIEELKQAYRSAALDCGDGLLPPAAEAALALLSSQLGLPLPPELREVFQVHGGQQAPPS